MTRRCPWKKPRPAAMPEQQNKTASSMPPARRPSSWFVRGEHTFHIVGYSAREALAGDAHPSILSGAFHVGGHTWALACDFDKKGQLASVSLQLLTAYVTDEIVAKGSLTIEDPLHRFPAAVWQSGDAYTFPAEPGGSWELSLPDGFRGREAQYVHDDSLTILCTLDVLQEEEPSIAEDIHKLLLVPLDSELEPDSQKRRRACMQPDVMFVVNQTEVQAHRLVLAMRSPVFAAQLLGPMREGTTPRIKIEDMSASTFRAMVRFIYTDELPIKQEQNNKDKRAARRREAMARDLLVAADRYDLEKLRLMCEKILYKSMDANSVLATLMVVHGRHSSRRLEASCIEYLASSTDVYSTVKATDDYKELEKSCCSFIEEIAEKVTTCKLVAGNNSSFDTYYSDWRPEKKSVSTYKTSEVIRGTYGWRIPDFSSTRRSHGVDDEIVSNPFKIGGYDWKLIMLPCGTSESLKEKNTKGKQIAVYVFLLSDPGPAGVRASVCFRMDDPSGKLPSTIARIQSVYAREMGWGTDQFTSVKYAKSRYLAHDGSLTIHCDFVITNKSFIIGTCTTSSCDEDMTFVPPPNISWHLERLLASEIGSDVTFLVEKQEIRAHKLVIATRSPTLYELVAMANEEEQVIPVDDIKVAVFKAVLHFIYTGKLPPWEDLVPAASAAADDVMMFTEMLAVACRFHLDRMKAKCKNLLGE